jgi:hypothetical protein
MMYVRPAPSSAWTAPAFSESTFVALEQGHQLLAFIEDIEVDRLPELRRANEDDERLVLWGDI